ncbi:MAG: hypothetical protein COA80_14340, partial [Leeuwenhoekiella sp.]
MKNQNRIKLSKKLRKVSVDEGLHIAKDLLNVLTERKNGIGSEIIGKVKQLKSTALKLEAEKAKIQLSGNFVAAIRQGDLIPNFDMNYRFDRKNFEDWIQPDIDEAIARLKQCIDSTGAPLQSIRRLIYSGGTCNIPAVQQR